MSGTILDVEKQPEGDWFKFFESHIKDDGKIEYDDPKPDAGRVRIRGIATFLEERLAKRKQKAEFVLNTATRQMDRVTWFEDLPPEELRKQKEDLYDFMITGIEDLKDAKGVPFECTREHKTLLMSVPIFDRFVARCLQLQASSGVKAQEEQEKNVLPT